MQNRSNYDVLWDPIDLPSEIPLRTGELFTQTDRKIVYLHRHNHWEFGLCLGGYGIFVIGTQICSFSEQDVVCIPPSVPHLAQSASGSTSRWRWSYLDFERLLRPSFPWLELDLLGTLPGGVVHGNGELSESLRRLQSCRDTREDRIAQSLLFFSSLRTLPRSPERSDFRGGDMDRIGRAIRYLSSHYTEKVNLNQVAAVCGMSPAGFRRAFHEAAGCSPMEYLIRLRITRAKSLLRSSDLPVSVIAFECGYPTISCFNRAFHRAVGCPPGEYAGK